MAELELVLYASSFCGACAVTRERIELVASAVGAGRVTWREVNVAKEPELAESLGIDSTPTVTLVNPDRGELMRASGVPSLQQLLHAIAVNL